jgi:parallel beta-helix repeat protein
LGNTGVGLEISGQNTTPGNTTEIIVLGNTFRSNGVWASTGLQLNSYESRVKIEANQFYTFNSSAGTAYAIFVGDGDPPLIVGNTFNSCAYGIWVNSASVASGVISTNCFWNLPTAYAARAINLASAGDGWLIEQNCIDSDPVNGGVGITIASGNQHRVIGNRIQATNPMSISMNDGLVEGNIVLKNVSDGVGAIRIQNSSSCNVVRNNVVTNTPGYTISIEGTSDYNQVSGNQFPASIDASGDVSNTSTGTHNTIDSNSQNAIFVSEFLRLLPSVAVGTTQVAAPHGLGYTPAQVLVSMTSVGSIYRSATSDATNVYLTADAPLRTADVYVR